MKRLIAFIFVFSCLCLAAEAKVRFAAGGLSFGLSIGYSPDVYFLSDRGEQLANQNLKILNRLDKINSTYNSNAYGQSKVVRDYRASRNSVGGIPVEATVKYSWYGILFRIGFVYYNVPTDARSYVLTTGAATTRNQPSASGSDTLYKDLNNLHDSNANNDELLAVGLRSTYGQPVRFTQFLKVGRFELPVTFGISMFDLGPASFFFGGGMTLFFSTKTRVVKATAETGSLNNPEFFVDDVDKFTSTALGFHIMLGGEYRFLKDVGLTMEMSLTFGGTGPITDSVRTGAFTNDSLFHLNDGKDFGGNEKSEEINIEKSAAGAESVQIGKGLERTDSFDFTGIRLMIGINYHIARNKRPAKK